VFPHHENEIAQSEAVTGQPLARYWLHNGMVRVNGEKMAKSTGNFTTIRDLLNRPLDPMVLRLFVLQAHYRKPLDFTEAAIDSARHSWNTLQQGLLWGNSHQSELSLDIPPFSAPISRFQAVMDDDFNTAAALAVIFELAKDLRRESANKQENIAKWQTLVYLAKILGLEANPEPENLSSSLPETAIQDLIIQRNSARKAKNYAESDRLREKLKMMGITLIDLPNGQTEWHPREKSHKQD
jgi:cysteinyl-tRNA synthetase